MGKRIITVVFDSQGSMPDGEVTLFSFTEAGSKTVTVDTASVTAAVFAVRATPLVAVTGGV